MVESVKHTVNRIEVQRGQDRKANASANNSASSPKPAVPGVDAAEVSKAAAPKKVAMLADKPPVDTAAVERIKTAIKQGRYPIDLDSISDALMDAYRDLKG